MTSQQSSGAPSSGVGETRKAVVSPSDGSVPYVDLVALHAPLKERILEAIGRVLDHGQFILGPEVRELEERLGERFGAAHVVTVNSGTDALVLGLRAAGIGPGDEVVTVSHSFVATASAIRLLGARPVFCEIDEASMVMDPVALESLVTERTRAVVPVHLNGHPCRMEEIENLCRRRGLALIEDCAQAFGARWAGRSVGTFGIGCFSLHPLKTVSVLGDGGFLTVSDEKTATRLREWRNLGLRDRDHCRWVSGNSRLDSIHAAVLLTKLDAVDEWIAARRRHAAAYRRGLADTALELPPPEDGGFEPVYCPFVVRFERRDALREGLARRGIDAKAHYPLAIHQQEAFADLGPVSLPVTERVVDRILSLPSGPQLSDEQRDRVVAGVLDTLEELGA